MKRFAFPSAPALSARLTRDEDGIEAPTNPILGKRTSDPRPFRSRVMSRPEQKTKSRHLAGTTMNIKSYLTLGLGLIAIPLALHATSFDKAYLESYRTHKDEPVPVFVTSPRVSSEFAGHEVRLEFVVDPTGKPSHFTSATPAADPRLTDSIVNAVKQWRFDPAYRNGKPVACRVELPVEIVAKGESGIFGN